MNKTKIQSLKIDLKTGDLGVISNQITLDSTYKRVVGMAVVELNTNSENYAIAVQNDHEVFHHLAHKNFWISSTNVAPKDRFKQTHIDILSDQKLEIRTKIETALTSDVSYEIYFLMEKNA